MRLFRLRYTLSPVIHPSLNIQEFREMTDKGSSKKGFENLLSPLEIKGARCRG